MQIRIHDWMVRDLSLRGNELLTYAYLYSRANDGEFHVIELRQIADSIGSSTATIRGVLIRLLAKKLIEKQVNDYWVGYVNFGPRNYYRVVRPNHKGE